MSERDEMPGDVWEKAREAVAEWLDEQEGYAIRRERLPLDAKDIGWLETAWALGAMEGRERGLLDAKAAVHCGCDNYCDFDEAEEKIDDLIAAIRSGKSEQGGER